MAFQPWSLGLYLAIAVLATVAVWLLSRRNRTTPRRVVNTLMTGIAAALSCFVWWSGQGDENWLANELYLVAFGALFVAGATLSVVSVALPPQRLSGEIPAPHA